MFRLLAGASLMMLLLWLIYGSVADMTADAFKGLHFWVGVIFTLGSLRAYEQYDFGPAALLWIVFGGFLGGSWMLIGNPWWVGMSVFFGALVLTGIGWFIHAYFFYRYGPHAAEILVDSNGDLVVTPRAGMTEHEITLEARRLARKISDPPA